MNIFRDVVARSISWFADHLLSIAWSIAPHESLDGQIMPMDRITSETALTMSVDDFQRSIDAYKNIDREQQIHAIMREITK